MAAPYTVTLDPVAVSTGRTELSLNSGSIRIGGDAGTGIDWGQSEITAYESEMQQWGNSVSDFRVPNRTVTIPLMLGADDTGSFETAFAQLRQKVALFQREGGWLLRQRADGDPLYADVVNATLTVPDVWGEAGELETGVSLVLECLPDFYGDEITLDEIFCTGYCDAVLQLDGEQAVIEGDHPGRVRIIVTDTSGNDQITAFWGFRSRHYDSSASASLFQDANAMTGLNGTASAPLSGAYGGTAMTKTSLGTSWTQILSTVVASSPLTHAGSYRVWTRCWSNPTPTSLRLNWAQTVLATPIVNDEALIPGSGTLSDVSLGVVHLQDAPVGDGAWWGIIEASTTAPGGSVAIDVIWLQPLDESAGLLTGNAGTAWDMTAGPGRGAVDAVVYADENAEIRTDGAYRTTDGAEYGPVASVEGDLPRIPPSGMEGRPVELLVKPSRSSNNDSAIDPFTVQVIYRPTWLFRP